MGTTFGGGGVRVYAIGDIHGQLAMLEAAHALIEADRRSTRDVAAPVVHLGDLVDRGPDSRGVIDRLLGGVEAGEPWVVLRGNHDTMLLDFLSENRNPDDQLRVGLNWVNDRVGGLTTLRSYGVSSGLMKSRKALVAEAREKIPDAHAAFLKRLPLLYATTDLLFVHAGIRPGVPITAQTEDDLTWIRDGFLTDTRDHGPLIVHGHTPVENAEHRGNRVNLDTGAGFGRKLTAAVFEGRDCWVLSEAGRVPLRPPPNF